MANFSDPVKGMSDADVRSIVEGLIDDSLLWDNTGYNLNQIPTAILRDALYGAQNSTHGLFGSREGMVPQAVQRRVNRLGNAYRPWREFTRTGVDLYRLRNPNEIVVPYARSYNEEWGPMSRVSDAILRQARLAEEQGSGAGDYYPPMD